MTVATLGDAIASVSREGQVIVMRKEPSTAEKKNGAFAPHLVDLTDRIRLRAVRERHGRSTHDRSLGTAAPVWEGSHEEPGAPDVATLARLIGAYAPHDGRFALAHSRSLCHPRLTAVYRVGAYLVATRLVHCRAGRQAGDARAACLRVRRVACARLRS